MNRMRIAWMVLLCLLFAAAAYALPQQDEPKPHEQQPETKPEKQEKEKKENAKPEKPNKEKEADQAKQDQNKQDQNKEKEANPSAKSERENGNGREMNGQSGNLHPAGKGAHIPDDKFRSHFGRQHTFRVSRPVVVNNQQTIEYGGYNFVLVDAWPADWAYTDDCYIDYIDGEYFLFDLLHPGVRIAVFVVE